MDLQIDVLSIATKMVPRPRFAVYIGMVEDTCRPPYSIPRTGGAETILVAIESMSMQGCGPVMRNRNVHQRNTPKQDCTTRHIMLNLGADWFRTGCMSHSFRHTPPLRKANGLHALFTLVDALGYLVLQSQLKVNRQPHLPASVGRSFSSYPIVEKHIRKPNHSKTHACCLYNSHTGK